MFSKFVQCPNCKQQFMAELTFEPPSDNVVNESVQIQKQPPAESKTKAQLLQQEAITKIASISEKIKELQPLIEHALQNSSNESSTKLIIDRVLQDALGYDIHDILMEKNIQGKKADYVLSVQGKPVLVLEAKRIGLELKEQQVIQATSYGAYSGIKWALLTNLRVWKLYYINFEEGKITPELILEIDLRDGLSKEEASYFYMFSKHGMENQGFLEKMRQKVKALCRENLLAALFSEAVISQLCKTLTEISQCRLTEADIRKAVELQLIKSA
jgi:predicted type IV restriction endonuclease